jgi:hypothetical protein
MLGIKQLQKWFARRMIVTLTVSALVAAAAFLALVAATNTPPVLRTVSAKTLAASRISLEAPTLGFGPKISQASAERVAVLGESPGTAVRESVLAHVTVSGTVPPVECDCWVVSIMPGGGIWSNPPSGQKAQPGSYDVRFIDAATGQFVFGNEGGTVP